MSKTIRVSNEVYEYLTKLKRQMEKLIQAKRKDGLKDYSRIIVTYDDVIRYIIRLVKKYRKISKSSTVYVPKKMSPEGGGFDDFLRSLGLKV